MWCRICACCIKTTLYSVRYGSCHTPAALRCREEGGEIGRGRVAGSDTWFNGTSCGAKVNDWALEPRNRMFSWCGFETGRWSGTIVKRWCMDICLKMKSWIGGMGRDRCLECEEVSFVRCKYEGKCGGQWYDEPSGSDSSVPVKLPSIYW